MVAGTACSRPHPWTVRRLQAAADLIGESNSLSAAERETLKKSLEELTRETPVAEVAAIRFKRPVGQARRPAREALLHTVLPLLSGKVRELLGHLPA
jgi:hypothetical protein